MAKKDPQSAKALAERPGMDLPGEALAGMQRDLRSLLGEEPPAGDVSPFGD